MTTNGRSAPATGRVAVTLPVRDFSLDWRRFNLVANYVAEYASYFYEHKDRSENLISSVFYELLEHMAAISRADALLSLCLGAQDGRILFEIASSGVEPRARARHDELVAGLRRRDLDAWYQGVLEKQPDPEDPCGTLGLALLAHDYHADISTAGGESGSVVLRALVDQAEMNP